MYNIVFIGCIVCIYVGKVNALCAPGCLDGWTGDNVCDMACYNAVCNWDDGDCFGMSGDDDISHDDDDDDIWTGECSLSSCPGVHQGHCGAFGQETDKWCDMGGTEVCCAENPDDCCEPNGGAIAGTVIGIVVLIGVCCYYCCNCNKDKDNNNKDYGEPPNCCFKFWCPPCAVCSHQGCDDPCDVIMSLFFGWLFTLCCWQPKTKTYVAPPNIYDISQNKEGDIEIPTNASIAQPQVYQQSASYIVHSDSKTDPI